MNKKRGAIELNTLVAIIIGLLALAIFAVIYLLVGGKGGAALDYLRNILRLR